MKLVEANIKTATQKRNNNDYYYQAIEIARHLEYIARKQYDKFIRNMSHPQRTCRECKFFGKTWRFNLYCNFMSGRVGTIIELCSSPYRVIVIKFVYGKPTVLSKIVKSLVRETKKVYITI